MGFCSGMRLSIFALNIGLKQSGNSVGTSVSVMLIKEAGLPSFCLEWAFQIPKFIFHIIEL